MGVGHTGVMVGVGERRRAFHQVARGGLAGESFQLGSKGQEGDSHAKASVTLQSRAARENRTRS